MARVIFDRLAATIRAGRLGPGRRAERLKVNPARAARRMGELRGRAVKPPTRERAQTSISSSPGPRPAHRGAASRCPYPSTNHATSAGPSSSPRPARPLPRRRAPGARRPAHGLATSRRSGAWSSTGSRSVACRRSRSEARRTAGAGRWCTTRRRRGLRPGAAALPQLASEQTGPRFRRRAPPRSPPAPFTARRLRTSGRARRSAQVELGVAPLARRPPRRADAARRCAWPACHAGQDVLVRALGALRSAAPGALHS